MSTNWEYIIVCELSSVDFIVMVIRKFISYHELVCACVKCGAFTQFVDSLT